MVVVTNGGGGAKHQTPFKQHYEMLQVTSMTPGTHWRRLRNTLKAAQEMQGTKKKQVLSREDSFLRKFSTRNQRLHSQVLQLNDDTDAAGHSGAFHRSSSSPRFEYIFSLFYSLQSISISYIISEMSMVFSQS